MTLVEGIPINTITLFLREKKKKTPVDFMPTSSFYKFEIFNICPLNSG